MVIQKKYHEFGCLWWADSSPSPSLRAQTVWGRGGESARQPVTECIRPYGSPFSTLWRDAPVCIHNQRVTWHTHNKLLSA